ncbi:MAG: LicD family protein [Butyrivibrio sp.]|nr:LicD family protein [Butyrivibrio sp.]
MLQIPKGFFEKEIRLDHEISEKFKHAWAIQLTVLDQVLEIAARHKIPVWLDYGSLLGAVRHKGYVPWDDDIDICAMRSDYMRLLFILEKELPQYCRVRSLYTTEGYDQPKGFIACRKSIDVGKGGEESEITKIYYGCPYCTGLDFYPLDYAPKDEEQWELIRQIYIAVYDLAHEMDEYVKTGEFEDLLCQVEDLLKVSIPRDAHIKQNLWKLADNVAQMTTKEEAGYCLWYPDAAMRENDMRRPIEAYEETIITDFEMLKAPIPKGYDAVLRACYWDDYMTPLKLEPAHDYPFFKGQEEMIAKYQK